MIAFAMIVRDELRDDAPEVPLPQRNDSIETFFPDRPDESFCVGIRIRRTFGDQHDTDARLLESTPYVTALFAAASRIVPPFTDNEPVAA